MLGPTLVATDGSAGAMGALRVAAALEARGATPPRVLAVHVPLPLYDGAAASQAAQEVVDRSGADALREQVRAQLAELGGRAAGWEVRVEVGPASATVARVAEEIGAALVLAGLGGHGVVERWMGGETVLRIMHLARCPVLAAHPLAEALPRSVLVAEDFSVPAREAAERARELLGEGGALHLAHVVQLPPPLMGVTGSPVEWLDGYLATTGARLEERRRELAADGAGPVEAHLLQGDPSAELVRLADSLAVDLVAAGSHGHGFVGRLLVGSVSTRLVRRARRSVLVVPPPASESASSADAS